MAIWNIYENIKTQTYIELSPLHNQPYAPLDCLRFIVLITLISAAYPIPRTPHAREWLHWYIIRFDLNTKSWDPHDVSSRTGNLPINNHSAPAHYGISAEVALCPGQRSTLWNKYFNKCNSYIPTTISKYIIAFLFNFNCCKFPQTHFVKAINHAKQSVQFLLQNLPLL